MSKKIEIQLIVDEKGAVTGVRSADGAIVDLRRSTEAAERSTKRLSTSMKIGLAAAAVAVAGLARKGFNVLNQAVKDAGVQQIAERKLEQALKNTGDASEASARQLKQLASEVQNVSNFGDEAIITAQAMLLSFAEVGGARGAAMLTPRLADVAAGVAKVTGQTVDLNTVSAALGKSLAQGAGSLREYGISLTESEEAAFNAAEGMDRVRLLTEILDKNFKGLAEATADPFVQASNAVGDLREQLGLAVRGELAQFAQKTQEIAQDPQTVGFVQAIGQAVARGMQLAAAGIQFFGRVSVAARVRIREIVATTKAARIVFNEFLIDTLRLIENNQLLARALGLGGYIEQAKANIRELEIRNVVLEAQFKSERQVIEGIRAGSDALRAELPDIAASTAAWQANAAAKGAAAAAGPSSPHRGALGGLSGMGAAGMGGEDDFLAASDRRVQIMERELASAQRVVEAEQRLAEQRMQIEQMKQAALEQTLAAQIAADNASIQSGRDAVLATLAGVRRVVKAMIAESIAKAIAKIPFPVNLFAAPPAAAALELMFNKLVPAFETGGFSRGGRAMVGEAGAEMVTLPSGARVHTANETRGIMGLIGQQAGRLSGGITDKAVQDQTNALGAAIGTLGDRIEGIRVELSMPAFHERYTRYKREQRLIGVEVD